MENTEWYESREQAPWNHNGTEEIVDQWPTVTLAIPTLHRPTRG